jgi:hypothetical protein
VPLVCYPDPDIPLKKDPRPVDYLLRHVLQKTTINAKILQVLHTPSSYEVGLQAADVVAGTIFYRITKRYNFGTMLDPVRSLIEVDQWSVFPRTALSVLKELL